MKKPIVFFSHSSKDKEFINSLKNLLLQKTGSSIDIFVSSDGQSIPFGKNWVSSIEENLKETSLCFVFLSPASIHSQWIYFEAGYTYSKDINVTPVGILGTDLNNITPPLSLLQGFNVNNEKGLNNILAIINKTYSLKFDLNFSSLDFQNIFTATSANYGFFGNYTELIDNFVFRFHNIKTEDPITLIEGALKKEKVEFVKRNQVGSDNKIQNQYLESFGLELTYEKRNSEMSISLDKDLIEKHIKILNCFGETIRYESGSIYIKFIEGTDCPKEEYKITSKLYDTNIKFIELKKYRFENINFKIFNNSSRNSGYPFVSLDISFNENKFKTLKVTQLIGLLFDKGIIEMY